MTRVPSKKKAEKRRKRGRDRQKKGEYVSLSIKYQRKKEQTISENYLGIRQRGRIKDWLEDADPPFGRLLLKTGSRKT